MEKLIVILIFSLFAGCMSTVKQVDKRLPFYNSPDFTPQWIREGEPGYSSIHTIAPFTFTNQDGRIITSKDVEGKIYVANFFFVKCLGICPKMNGNLERVQKEFVNDSDVVMLSHSVMPEADSVEALARYAKLHNIDGNRWWLLTGDKEGIYTLARKSYFADDDIGMSKGAKDFLHTENVILVDGKGRIRGVYNGTLELEVEKLIEHIRLLKKEG